MRIRCSGFLRFTPHPEPMRLRHLIVPLALFAGACSDAPAPHPEDSRGAPTLAETPRQIATTGLDSTLLAGALARADSLPNLYSFLVWRQGETFVEEYYQGRTAETPANIKSVSKTILATLAGIALAEGDLQSVDQSIAPFFAEYLTDEADPAKGEITLGNLLSMQAGLQSTSGRNYGRWVTSGNWVRFAITRPMVDAPGGRMQYSTGTSHLLSAVLTEATGMSTYAYAREKLAKPLGINIPPWTTDPQGIYFGGNEMRMTPRALLRFGEMILNGGEINDTRVVPEDWIRTSWEPRTQSRFNSHRYGYGWWIEEMAGLPVYFAWGYGGQYLFLVPDLELIVVTTSVADGAEGSGRHRRAIQEIVARQLVPAAIEGGAEAAIL